MKYVVIDKAKNRRLEFEDEDASIDAFCEIFCPRYRALVKKFGKEPNEEQKAAFRKVLLEKVVSYEFDFSDDIDPETGELREGVLEREGLAFDEDGNLYEARRAGETIEVTE